MLRSCLMFKLESASSKRVPCHFLQENLVQARLTRTSSKIRSAWLERPSTAIIHLLWCYVTSAALAFHEFFSMQLRAELKANCAKMTCPVFSQAKKTVADFKLMLENLEFPPSLGLIAQAQTNQNGRKSHEKVVHGPQITTLQSVVERLLSFAKTNLGISTHNGPDHHVIQKACASKC